MTFTEASQLTKEQIARAFGVPAHILVDPDRPAVPRTWSLCMTSENHGTVGPAGCTFSHAPEKHERVLVVEVVAAGSPPAPGVDLTGLLRITIDGTVIPLATSFAPAVASTVLRDERMPVLRIMHIAQECDIHTLDDRRTVSFARAIEREVAAQAGQVAVPPPAGQPMIGKLLDQFSELPVLWGLNEPGALVRHSDVFKMLVTVGKEYAPSPAKESK